jgi:outer membrane protein assembly factor BamB
MKSLRTFPLVLIGLVASIALNAADWPQYRGPNHDGSSSESLRTNWAEKPPRVVWKRSIGPAWSSITVSGGRVFTQVNRRRLNEDREMCVALNADTGAELWATALDGASYPDAGTGSTDGPRSTPTVEGDRVYVFTSYLKLYCLRADTGQVIWSRDFVAEFPGTEVINWQNAASPLLVGDLIFLNSNASLPSGAPGRRLTAVRKSDGVTVWSGQTDTMTHATPVSATIAGTPQVVFLTLRGMVGVVPETGRVLWRHSFSPSATSTAATPIVADDYVYASCAYAKGAWTARVNRTGNSFGIGSVNYTGPNSSYQNHWATPVHHDGFLYSVVERSNHSLACFSLAGRTNTWISRTVGSGNPGFASLIKVGGKLLVLTEPGELVLLEPNPQAYTEIARYKALTGTAWNHPAFSNGRIYARSDTQIVALDVAAAVEPLPGLQLSAAVPAESGRLKFRVVAADNSVLTASHAARLELQLAPVPGPTLPAWQTSPVSLIENAGGLEADLPLPAESTLARVTERNRP